MKKLKNMFFTTGDILNIPKCPTINPIISVPTVDPKLNDLTLNFPIR